MHNPNIPNLFRYVSSNVNFEPGNEGFMPKEGDYSTLIPGERRGKSKTPAELEYLNQRERKAYEMRWNLKGHPRLFAMIGNTIRCSAEEAQTLVELAGYKIRYFRMLSVN